jgi:ribosome-associated translation inhibitor RaiA
VAVEISVKDRGGKKQQVTMLADLPGYPPVVAKAANQQLDEAIAEAKRELVRQIEDAKGKREPKDNRRLRENLNERLREPGR